MATMTFLSTFDGSAAYQKAGGSGTMTSVGTVTYATGYAAATQAGVFTGTVRVTTTVADALSPTAGALAIRFQRDVDAGAVQYLIAAGQLGSNDYLGMRVDGSDRLDAVYRVATGTINLQAVASPLVGTDTWHMGYTDWNGTAARVGLNSDALVSFTRDTPAGAWTGGSPLAIGSYTDGTMSSQSTIAQVVGFDGPLTDDERAYLDSVDVWTWGMSLAGTVTAYVDTVPSNGTRVDAPVLILP